MDLRKLVTDAGGFFNRAKQFTEETFLKAEKTELDPNFEALLQRADKTEENVRKLLSCMESYLQPNPTLRMEEILYQKLDMKKEGYRQNNLEHLGHCMLDAGNDLGHDNTFGSALSKVAQTQLKLGAVEREFISGCASCTLVPMRRFVEGDLKSIQKERKVLNNRRLDLDAAKNRLKKAKTLESQANAEADLRVAQAEFEKQMEITKLMLEGIQTSQGNLAKHLRDFVEAQMLYFAQAHQHLADLQRELHNSNNATNNQQLQNSIDNLNGASSATKKTSSTKTGTSTAGHSSTSLNTSCSVRGSSAAVSGGAPPTFDL